RCAIFLIFVYGGVINLHALGISKAEPAQLFDLSADPAETPFLVGVRIVDPGHLLGAGEEILLDEEVVFRKEYSKAGMRMVPSHDLGVGILLVLDLVDVLPGILGEGDMGAALRGVDTGNASLDDGAILVRAANQHAAHLSLHGGA